MKAPTMAQPPPPPPRRPPPPTAGNAPHPPPHPHNARPLPPPMQHQQQQKQKQSPPPAPPSATSATAVIHRVPVSPSHFDENHLPSVLFHPNPMTPEAERQTRRRTIRFIEEAGQRSLRMPRVAVSTATVFFHRFYAKHAFQEHDRFEVAMASLLLAGKTEESPRKLEVVLRECWKLRRRAQQQQQQRQIGGGSGGGGGGGDSPAPSPTSATSADNIQIDPKSEEYIRLKERVLLLERVILHTIGFELNIEHPYKYLVDFVQEKKRLLEYVKTPPPPPPSTSSSSSTQSQQPGGKSAQNAQMVQELAQNAMNFANDSMHTSLCLQYTAREIAMACVYLSGKYSGIRPVSPSSLSSGGNVVGGSNKQWIDLLDGITVEDLTTICIQIMELVQPRKGMESDMAFKLIRKDLEDMGVMGGISMGTVGGVESAALPDAKRMKTD